MAPPAIQSLDNFSDVQFRDIIGRHQHQIGTSGNVIRKLHTHVDANNVPTLSSVQTVALDANAGAWNLLLQSSANPMSAESIATANSTTLAANATITATPALTAFRSGNVQVTGNLETSGTAKLGNQIVQSFRRTLATASGSSVEICKIEATELVFLAEISVIQRQGNFARHYKVAISGSTSTGGSFHRVLPLTNTTANSPFLEISHEGAGSTDVVMLRLVRSTTGLDSAELECVLRLSFNGATPPVITPLNGALSDQTPSTTLFENTLISQVNGRVGINTDAPTTNLDVRGNTSITGTLGVTGSANVSGTYQIGGTNVLSASALGSGVTTSSLTSVGNLTSLTVNGAVSASSLTVSGDINLDANTFKLDSANNRIGVNNDAPAYPLDVTGDINSTGVLRVGGTEVLNGTTLGSSITTSSLTTIGNLGNLTVSANGTCRLDNTIIRSFQRGLSSTANESSEICEIESGNQTYQVELRVVQDRTLGTSRLYAFSVGPGTWTSGNWHRLLPITICGNNIDSGTFIVEIKHDVGASGGTNLRLVRTVTGGSEVDIQCEVTVHQSGKSPVTITPLLGTATVTPAETIFENSLITQFNGNVGIGTDNPLYALDVVGASNFAGNLISGNIAVTGTANVNTLKATTLDIANLSTSGNVVSGNSSVFTQAAPTYFNFSDKIRLYYNETGDSLEIQRNTAGTWATTAILAA